MRPRPVVGEATVPDAVRRLLDKFDYPDRGESESQVIPILPTLGAGGGTGAFIHLSRNAVQSIAVNGEAISWDTEGLPRSTFADPNLAATTITIPAAGYYNISVAMSWSTYADGGDVTVIRTRNSIDTTVWPPADDPGVWSATTGDLFEGVAPAIECQTADTIQVVVDHNNASAQNLATAVLAVYLVDRMAEPCVDYRQTVLSDVPLAYWRLGEPSGTNANDETGGTNDGTYNGTPTLAAAGALFGDGDTAVTFDGVSEYVEADTVADNIDSSATFTLEVWFKTIATREEHLIWGGWTTNTDDFAGLSINLSDGSTVNSNYIIMRHRNNGSAENYVSYNTGAGHRDGAWHHMVGVFNDGGDLDLYYDGLLVASGSTTSTPTLDKFTIGGAIETGGLETNPFTGTLDEPAVYTRVLTSNEIAEHYRVGTEGC